MIGRQEYITFKKDTHQYLDPEGKNFLSVTRVLGQLQQPFDRQGISYRMALKQASDNGITVEQAQQEILDGWTEKLVSASEWGTSVHENIEAYLTIGSCDYMFVPVARRVAAFASQYYRFYPEAIVYSSKYEIAGMTDLALIRSKSRKGTKSIVDFFDYKTNESKGIQFDSGKRDSRGKIEKFYNRFLLSPVSHLEDCNYNLYSLQLSMYAFLAEDTFGIIPGRLGIIFINPDFSVKIYPVPYLRCEVENILEEMINKPTWEE